MASYRSSVKLHSNDRKQHWRDKFQSHCADRMKLARQEQMDQRRNDSWMNAVMAQEWERFQKENQEELNQAGVDLYADLENMNDNQQHGKNNTRWVNDTNLLLFFFVTSCLGEPDSALYEEYERMQQEELNTAIETYESLSQLSTTCINCQQYTLFQQGDNHQCATCGFTMKKELIDALNLTIHNHATSCHSQLEFMVEPGVNGSIIGLCSVCDLWMLI
ncbi:hypothetical protein BC941DRAFT_439241 [Chlamydoabsidia padenii]|nr:hypothetical protein BC941DRAFT_439241 [Chlamydoabsidia padenii]